MLCLSMERGSGLVLEHIQCGLNARQKKSCQRKDRLRKIWLNKQLSARSFFRETLIVSNRNTNSCMSFKNVSGKRKERVFPAPVEARQF